MREPAAKYRIADPARAAAWLAEWDALVWHLARRLHRTYPAADIEDLHAEVRAGFVRAAATFDESRGYTFPAYAYRAGLRFGLRFVRAEAARGLHVPHSQGTRYVSVGTLDADADRFDTPDAHRVPDPRPVPDAVEAADLWEVVARHLPDRHAEALELYYRHGQTLDQIGGRFGVSRARASQLVLAAVASLKRHVGASPGLFTGGPPGC